MWVHARYTISPATELGVFRHPAALTKRSFHTATDKLGFFPTEDTCVLAIFSREEDVMGRLPSDGQSSNITMSMSWRGCG